MIILINLSIFISHDVFKSRSTFQLLAKTNKNICYIAIFYSVSLKKNNNECLKNVSISH